MDDLLIKYLLGEATPEETGRVDQWLSEDERHRERFRQFSAAWEINGRSGSSAAPDAQAALQRLRLRLKAGHPDPSVPADFPSDKKALVNRVSRWRIAAIIAGALCMSAATWSLLRSSHRASTRPSLASRQPTISRDPGPADTLWMDGGKNVLTDSLPDGSKVTLNRHASIAFPAKWKDRRSVRLEGEAFFSIAPDPSRPFVVVVNDLTVTVLGTTFNIRSQTGSTEIVVETGAVLVSRAGDSLILHPGEKLSALNRGTTPARELALNKKEKLKKEMNTDRLVGWYLDRPLICDSISLGRLVEILNKKYDAHVVIGRKELNDLPLTTVLPQQPLHNILTVIATTFDLSIHSEGGTIILQ